MPDNNLIRLYSAITRITSASNCYITSFILQTYYFMLSSHSLSFKLLRSIITERFVGNTNLDMTAYKTICRLLSCIFSSIFTFKKERSIMIRINLKLLFEYIMLPENTEGYE
ncbi:hypothetical protein V1478_013410 [Vespula squamosa]|uniref:Uncharacterized protein n=1 Tax=Vespula squamosa TaxID=30214 RepID=A0ABD2ADD5_VESSQ